MSLIGSLACRRDDSKVRSIGWLAKANLVFQRSEPDCNSSFSSPSVSGLIFAKHCDAAADQSYSTSRAWFCFHARN